MIAGVVDWFLMEVVELLRPPTPMLPPAFPGLLLPCTIVGVLPLLVDSCISWPDSVMGENIRWERDKAVMGEEEGEGVRVSEFRNAGPSSSSSSLDKSMDMYGSNLGRFTVSSTLSVI